MPVSEYNQRQYRQMLGTIHRYELGQMTLDTLLSNLGALGQCIEDASDSWLAELQAELGTLDQVYAIVCLRNEEGGDTQNIEAIEPTSSEDYENVWEALTNIKNLISAQTDRTD